MNTPSEEQSAILTHVENNRNIYCDAVPGAGKSTLSYFIASQNKSKTVLSVTFSKDLKKEARDKIEKLGLMNMKIESYNSLARNYYDNTAITNDGIERILRYNTELICSDKIDIFILDESQDMNIVHFRLIKKFINDNNPDMQLVVLGDKDQAVFKFLGSDHRFLTLSRNIYDKPFIKSDLTLSYRLTNEMGQFINNFILGYDKIKTIKPGKPVKYVVSKPYDRELFQYLFDIIKNKMEIENYRLEDIFVLCNSVKKTNRKQKPIIAFENFLVRQKINGERPNIYINKSDEGQLNQKELKNKIVLTTFHQSKGRERKLTIAFGVDESYYKYTHTGVSDECPPPIYVGTSRGIDELIVVHTYNNGCTRKIPIAKMTIHELSETDYCDVVMIGDIDRSLLDYNTRYVPQISKEHTSSVTSMTKYIRDSIQREIVNKIDDVYVKIHNSSNKIDLKSIIYNYNKKIHESVSDINGLIIPTIWEHSITGRSTIYDYIQHFKKNSQYMDFRLLDKIKEATDKYPFTDNNSWLLVGNIYNSIKGSILSNIYQIVGYNWLVESDVQKCLDRLNNQVSKDDIMFEMDLGNNRGYYVYQHKNYGEVKISGILDCINIHSVYELKCTCELSIEHKCQLLLYYWMYRNTKLEKQMGNKKFKLFNILTGEMFELKTDSPLIDDIVELLLENAYDDKDDISDDKFIERCLL